MNSLLIASILSFARYLSVCLFILLSQALPAQTNTQVNGRVTNSSGAGIAFATIQLGDTGVVTDEQGNFSLALPAGSYALRVSAVGYEAATRNFTTDGSNELLIVLTEKAEQLEEVVVTATRTSRAVDNVPMPVSIVSQDEIERIGSVRLDDVLREQTGLMITSDHGSGLQMQGLNSDYILFLIDGEPLIGRTAGTLDLRRLAVDNVERVEILKGPSSSLYGSEAMAGVVNIITSEPARGLEGNFHSQYRSFNTLELGANAGYSADRLKASLSVNRLNTAGYDLNKETLSMTAPPFTAWTISPKVSYNFSERVNFNLSTRFYTEEQENKSEITGDQQTFRAAENASREDWNLMPTLKIALNEAHHFQLRNYTTGYRTQTILTREDNGEIYSRNDFAQLFNRTEIQYDYYISSQNILTAGVGHTLETVDATRYDDVNSFTAGYGFLQYQWTPGERLNLIAGARFDMHSAYSSRFSPKLAVGYTFSEKLKVQASFGGGYKAPDFRQLLLNFTNPVAGYTVIGSNILEERLAEMEREGLIQSVLIDPSGSGEIRAESSLGYNLGFTYQPAPKLRSTINFFRNEISNLIDTTPVARKTNGQNVFSYFNFDEVVTQGAELNVSYEFLTSLGFSMGYQYLDARNMEDVERIRDGEVFRRDPSTNITEQVPLSDYGGLPNRSRHSGNAKVRYLNQSGNFDVTLRAIYRGKWGLGDANGNGIIDTDAEFADGYVLLNLGVNKRFGDWLIIETGVNNLLNTINLNEPSLPGRIWYTGVQINFN